MATAAKVWVGFDLGGTAMEAKVFDSRFRALGGRRCRSNADDGVKRGAARMVQAMAELLTELGLVKEQVAGIGVSGRGLLDSDAGVILHASSLGWEGAPARKTLEKAFGCPAVVINDVSARTHAEYLFGAGKGAHSLLGVLAGTGIRGSFVHDGGRILGGGTRNLPQIGHLQMQPDGPLCGCGRAGCLEAVASRPAVSAAAAAAAFRGDAPHLLAATGTDLANVCSNSLARAIHAGDKAVERIVRQAARWVGVAVGDAVNLLGPDTVVLGGGLVEAMPEIFLAETTLSAQARVMHSLAGTSKVVTAVLGDDATAKGAAGWAREVVVGRLT